MTGAGREVYSLALRELHTAAGGVMYERSGWNVPREYGDMEGEYAAIREGVAIIDRSHTSRVLVTGTDALDVLKEVMEGHPAELEEGRAMRTVWLDDAGHIGDLVLVARTGAISYLVMGEPGRRARTIARLEGAQEEGWDVQVADRTETTCLLAVTGPGSAEAVGRHLSESLPGRIRPMQVSAFEAHGFRAMAVRSSDTGEDGFLLMLAPAVAQHLVETLRQSGARLAGDGAHEVARVEACIPAFEPDLEGGLSPAEADLDALLGIPGGVEGRILAGLMVDGGPVGGGTPVDGARGVVGEVRSCVRSGLGGATISLAIIEAAHAVPGSELGVAGQRATVVAKPFYRRRRTERG